MEKRKGKVRRAYEPPKLIDFTIDFVKGKGIEPKGWCIKGNAPSSGGCNLGLAPYTSCAPGGFIDICVVGSGV